MTTKSTPLTKQSVPNPPQPQGEGAQKPPSEGDTVRQRYKFATEGLK